MNNLTKISDKDKADIFNTVATLKHISKEAVEKDWWVTAVLRSLFALPYSDNISFKGGTSLSKCWNLIERFSEDVDIAINREYFGFFGEIFSIKQISKNLRKACCKFCRNTLQYDLSKQMIADGIPENLFSVTMDITDVTTVDPEKIFINYKSLFHDGSRNEADSYISSVVVLEIGGRSMKEPLETVEVRSLVDDFFAGKPFVDKPFSVTAVAPERTFLEKVCLLHEEFSKRDQEKIRVNRMSRHLYDIVRMLNTPIAENAIKNRELYQSIIAHRRTFIAIKDFDYDTLMPKAINIIPPDNIIAQWEDDYNKMRTMIYGEAPDFKRVIEEIKGLNERIKQIDLSATLTPCVK